MGIPEPGGASVVGKDTQPQESPIKEMAKVNCADRRHFNISHAKKARSHSTAIRAQLESRSVQRNKVEHELAMVLNI